MGNALWNMAYVHLQAENATLKAKVESLEAKSKEVESGLNNIIRITEYRAKKAEAKLRALEGAARPFAKFGEMLTTSLGGNTPKSGSWYVLHTGTDKEATLTIEDFKAVIAAMEGAAHPTKGEEEANQGMRRAAPRDGGAA